MKVGEEEEEEEVVLSSKSEKLEKLGKLCVSLGLQPGRMTDKMLDTIELSKDIERNQRSVIQRLSSASPGEEVVVEAGEGQSLVVDDESDRSSVDMHLESVGKSLKRKRIPPPLTISETNSTTASLHGSGGSGVSHSFPQSAPAHVPSFPRSSVEKRFPPMGKPRVQYLGKVSGRAPQRNSPIQSTHAYKLKTPYVSGFPSYSVPPPMPYAPYYPYGYPAQLPMYQSTPQQLYNTPMVPQWQPRSAMPYSSQARYLQEKGKRGRQQSDQQPKKQRTKDAEEVLQATKPKDPQQHDSADQEHPADHEPDHEPDNNDDTESAHLAIEDDPRPFPSSEPRGPNVLGEIRISGNVFSYEFPSGRPSIDKKMFMSICDKVWDESRRLVSESP